MITELILKKSIKDYKNTRETEVRAQYGILEGWISVVINIVLFIIKLSAGLFVNSISLIADAIHSVSDMFSSAAVIWGFKMSATPPDREHPFGHGRTEHVATLIIAILLIITGVEFLKVAGKRIIEPAQVIYSLPVVLIVSLTIILKEWLSFFSKELGKRIKSNALLGDSIHHRSDAVTSIMVLLALFSEKINFAYLDGIVGIVISIYIMYSGWKMLQEVINPLLGESASYEELLQIKSIAIAVKPVKGVHDIIFHKYGNLKIISLHVELPEELLFMEAHNIIEEIEEKINLQMSATTTIHLDPVQKMNDDLQEIHFVMNKIIKSNSKVESYHDLRMVKVKGAPTLVLDIVSSEGLDSKQILALRNEIISALKSSLPPYNIKLWVDINFNAVK